MSSDKPEPDSGAGIPRPLVGYQTPAAPACRQVEAAAGDMSLSEEARLEAGGDLAQIENQQLTDKKLADEFADIKENAEAILAQQKRGTRLKGG